jgi:HEAT repeat protein
MPVYVELQNYQPVRSTLDNPMEGQVLAALDQFWPELEARSLDQLPTGPQLRILFYGTDSLPDADRAVAVEQIQSLMKAYPHFEYILASRPSAIEWSKLQQDIDLHLLVIQPLSPTRIRHFLENLGQVEALGRLSVAGRKQIGRKLLKEIYQSQLFDLVATPRFMFEMLRQAQHGVYPSSRTDALRQWVEGSLTLIAPGQGMRAHAADTIYSLAWQMQLARRQVWPVIDAFRIMGSVRGSRGYDLESLYRDYLKHDLLDEVGELSLRFTYAPVQAYCCAKAIMIRDDRERVLGDITSMLGTASRLRWWEETLVFICGLMSEEGELDALRELLTCIVYSLNLLEDEYVFLAARCLLECRGHQRDLADIRQHVIQALGWRSLSRNEPRITNRVLATQLLSRLADPDAVVNLAQIVYQKARLNLEGAEDYEYSSVRMAAAIGLKRMKSRKKVDETLGDVHEDLVAIFNHWEETDSQALIALFEKHNDAGIKAIIALAMGDVASQSILSRTQTGNKNVLACLKSAFFDEVTQSSVRWAVTDALAMIDTTTVSQEVIQPALAALADRPAGEQTAWLNQDKCLAYLIGLVRAQEPEAHAFLVGYCLGSSRDMRLWLTAMDALGSLGNLEHRQLLAGVALGYFGDQSLDDYFTDQDESYRIRRKAIEVLAEIGDEAIVNSLREGGLEKDERLAQSYYQATSDIYQRLE